MTTKVTPTTKSTLNVCWVSSAPAGLSWLSKTFWIRSMACLTKKKALDKLGDDIVKVHFLQICHQSLYYCTVCTVSCVHSVLIVQLSTSNVNHLLLVLTVQLPYLTTQAQMGGPRALLSSFAKEIRFAAHVKNMWVVSSIKLCQLYLLHWRRNN